MILIDAALVGYVAAVMTTAAFVPQVARAWRTRSTGDISLGMYALLVAGTGVWLVYGVLTEAPPVIASNVINICLQTSILYLKLRHG
jgi:MtN3 and saliva related transmembrane protein